MTSNQPGRAPFPESVYVADMKVSSTAAVLAEAERLRAEAVDLVDLGAREPDFPTPQNVKYAAQRALEENFTRYTSTSGIAALKRAIADMMQRDFGAGYDTSEVIVTVGAKQAVFNSMAALINPGDEVLIPAPYWVTFPEIAKFLRAVPVFIETEPNGFLLTAEAVANAITPQTKVLILNSPNNPTGRVVAQEEMRRIIEAAVKRGVWVICDECYLQFAYPPARAFTAGTVDRELRSRVMVCGSFSKSYAMTGWRIGYALGPAEWIQSMLKIQSHSTSNATSISQKAALEAAGGPQDSLRFMLGEYKRRRDWLIPALNKIEGIECPMPEGAFYAFPNVKGLLGKQITTSSALAKLLLDEARVVVTAGSSFGAEGYIRLSYANSLDNIQRGVERIAEAVRPLV